MRIYIGDLTFGTFDQKARYILAGEGVEIVNFLTEAEGVIAGTEPYTTEILSTVKNLRVISRMGVGYDNVDLDYCDKNGIAVTYTPDAPAGSVAELIIAQILNMVRCIPTMNNNIHNKQWDRPLGRKISELVIGVIGVGRIGKRVIKRLQPFNPKDILAHDINNDMVTSWWGESNLAFIPSINLNRVLEKSDIVTVSIPMNKYNKHFISRNFLCKMKNGSYLINTSRGEILDEDALDYRLRNDAGKLLGVALDVFSEEPYEGPLLKYDNVLFTSHIGSMTLSTRIAMETEAVNDCIAVLKGLNPKNLVPMMVKEIC